MTSADGVRYLGTEDQFLLQIVKSFAQLDPVRLAFLSAIFLFSYLSVQWCPRF